MGWRNRGVERYRTTNKKITEKKLSEERINAIEYTHFPIGLGIMEPPDSIEKVKAEIRKYGKNTKRNRMVNTVRNSRTNLGYI